MKYIFLLIFLPISLQAQYYTVVSQEAYENFIPNPSEFRLSQEGDIQIWTYRTKQIKILPDQSQEYLLVDNIFIQKDSIRIPFKSIQLDLIPMIVDCPYTIHFIEKIKADGRWGRLYKYNHGWALERIVKFYNFKEDLKREATLFQLHKILIL